MAAFKESIVSNFEAFAKRFPSLAEAQKESERLLALRRYFSKGGVISLATLPNEPDGWPEISYPTPAKLRNDLKQLKEQKKLWSSREGHWRFEFGKAKMQDIADEMVKFSSPTFWRHLAKYLTNNDYRKDADAVKLPVRLVAEKRWKPMIDMFVKDLDYRKQLTETVQTSVVYRHDKRLAKYALQLKEFRMTQASKGIDETKKQLSEIDADIAMLGEMLKWAR